MSTLAELLRDLRTINEVRSTLKRTKFQKRAAMRKSKMDKKSKVVSALATLTLAQKLQRRRAAKASAKSRTGRQVSTRRIEFR